MGSVDYKITMTQQDIDKAVAKDSTQCAVATAVRTSVPDANNITVDVQTIRFTTNGERRIYLTPPVVAGYVVAFDAGDELAPVTFTLRSDQRIKARTRKLTEAGKTKYNAYRRVQRAKAKVNTADTPAKKAVAVEELADAEQARAEVLAAYTSQATTKTTGQGVHAIPQVFKKKRRSYGMRALRINQPKHAAADS